MVTFIYTRISVRSSRLLGSARFVESSKRQARAILVLGMMGKAGEPQVDRLLAFLKYADARLRTSDLLHGRTILLRCGKKRWHATQWK